ncbi:thioesterase family protein [Beggiatoa leptomitoformis]|uniref:Thioesterase n=1 Tax=Beggiatoa leptomitoformis TaxID=288004 RepID=A0A2N9YBU1_9GAMM|nr:thioesterase family protein [Beggiatoa leptomitoformis]AUI67902.1 thioesterase [Beggiatoa leptomitoformis]QGX03491.1 thioesterase [Beggiatoa leptomitoformis]
MNLYFRLLLVLLKTWRGESLTPLDESILHLRVLPTDIDLHGNLQTNRYLSMMELGYTDLITRMGLRVLTRRQRWLFNIVAINLHYFYPLKVLQKYELSTRLLCWDNQCLYLEHRFQQDKKIVAIGQVKAIVRGRSGSIAPGYLLELLGYDPTSPNFPTAIQQWFKTI